jgi:nitroreductase
MVSIIIIVILSIVGIVITKKVLKSSKYRKSTYPVDPLILHRRSRYAMSGEPITDTELMTLLEAARWAPSSYNNQPWVFIYAKRDTDAWHKFLEVLVPFNQEWACKAGALVALVSRNTYYRNNKPSRTHSFDTGAAWENISLQGTSSGLVVHGMEGLDYEAATTMLELPDGYTLELMFAVGKPASVNTLPVALKEREKPSKRVPLEQLVCEGVFKPLRQQ